MLALDPARSAAQSARGQRPLVGATPLRDVALLPFARSDHARPDRGGRFAGVRQRQASPAQRAARRRSGRADRAAAPTAGPRTSRSAVACSGTRAPGRRRSRTDTDSSRRPGRIARERRPSAPPARSDDALLRAADAALRATTAVNSSISSRNSTPWCARLTSPGRGCDPPPTSAAFEMV